MSGTDIRLGETALLAVHEDRHTVPQHEGQRIRVTIPSTLPEAVMALRLAVIDNTAAVQALTLALTRPPWYRRLWSWFRAFVR